MPGSPCIDAADNSAVPAGTAVDRDRSGRFYDDPDTNDTGSGTAPIVDMGAYEYIQMPRIAVSPSEFKFFAVEAGPDSNSQILSIRNCGTGILQWQVTRNCSWLVIEPNNGCSTGDVNQVTLSVDASGLPVGSYDCKLTISDPNAVNDRQTLTVTLHVLGEVSYVPSQFTTIQQAVDYTPESSTIIVADGTYQGFGNHNIDFKGKAITLRSENGPENCIIHCRDFDEGPHRGFYFHSGEDANSIVEGLTIMSGHVGFGKKGAGILCENSSPTLINCTFFENVAEGNGGGLYNSAGSPTLINCTFRWNFAIGGNGGGLCSFAGSPGLTNCTFYFNTADFMGGAIYNSGDSPTLTNCTIWYNFNDGVSSDAGNLTLRNCIIWGHDTEIVGSASVTYTDVQGGYSGQGNINADPLFVDAAEDDYHLSLDSPAIDAGDPASDWSNEPWQNGSRVNMGAYGNTKEATRSRADFEDLATLAGYWLEDERFVDIAPEGGDGIINFLDFAVLAHYWAWEQ